MREWTIEESTEGGLYDICCGTQMVASRVTSDIAHQIVRDHNHAAQVQGLRAALSKARGFASIVDDKMLGPLTDYTRWAIKDLARILTEDVDAALASAPAGATEPTA